MTDYLNLDIGDHPELVNVVVEIPKYSNNKYEFDKKEKVFRLDRVLFSPLHYPGDYGFIPQTLAEDGDPLDALVAVDHPTFPSCVIECRPVGVLYMNDGGENDHKLIMVPVGSPRSKDIKTVDDFRAHYLKEVDYFFNVYKDLEGKKTKTFGWDDGTAAKKLIEDSVERYKIENKDLKEKSCKSVVE